MGSRRHRIDEAERLVHHRNSKDLAPHPRSLLSMLAKQPVGKLFCSTYALARGHGTFSF